MRCLKCGELVDNFDNCHNCQTNQEEYLFDNLNNFSLKQILSFIFQSGLFDNDINAIKAAFNDLLINYEAEKNVLGLILNERLFNQINNINNLEDANRLVNIETKKQVNKYGTSEKLVYNIIVDLVESIKPEFHIDEKTKSDILIEKEDNQKVIVKKDKTKKKEKKYQKSPINKKVIFGLLFSLIILISTAIYFNLRTPSNIDEEPVHTTNEEFTILYTTDNVNYTTFNMSDLDSFYEDGTWYVWYKDLGDTMYKYIIGNGFSSGDDNVTLKFGSVQVLMPLENGESYIQLTNDLSVPLGADIKVKSDKIYLPIEYILNMLHYPEYSDDGSQMIVRSSLDTEMIERYSSNQTTGQTNNEEEQNANVEFTISYTADNHNTTLKMSEMDSFYENGTWYIWYEQHTGGIGMFTNEGDELIFSNGTGEIVMDLNQNNESIIRVQDNGSISEFPLEVDIIKRSEKIYVPIEMILRKLNNAKYSTDGKQMNVEFIRDPQQLIKKLLAESAVLNPDNGLINTIAMITDSGTIDDESFNQGTWEGIVEYCSKNNITHKYYRPLEVSNEAYLEAIELAVNDGAKVVFTSGFLFESSIYEAQFKYPDVKFILIDGVPHTPDYAIFETADNTLSILFSEHEAGFLAGYAAVKDGYIKLGFTGGMAVPAVVKFGVGYIAGAYYAAEEEGVTLDFSNNTYHYLGSFAPSDSHKNLASSWYHNGTEVIFSASGGAGYSVMSAAEENNGKAIGVDIDQSTHSDTVITSALKQLGNAVMQSLDEWQNDKFVGGQTLIKGASSYGVALPMDTSRFNTFNQVVYDVIYNKISNGTIQVPENHEELVQFFAKEGITATNYPTADVVQP